MIPKLYPPVLYGTLRTWAEAFASTDLQSKKACLKQYEEQLRAMIELYSVAINEPNGMQLFQDQVEKVQDYLTPLVRLMKTTEEKAASVPHIRALHVTIYEAQKAIVVYSQVWDWLVEPAGGEMFTITRRASGANYISKDPIGDIMGQDRNSTAARNNYPLSGFEMGQVIAIAPCQLKKFRITRTIDMKPGVTMGLDSDNKVRPDQTEFGRDDLTVIKALIPGTVEVQPDFEVGGTKTMYIEWGGSVLFVGITFIADDQAGIATENHHEENEWQHFRDIAFLHCHIKGDWSATTNTNRWKSKWGLFTNGVGLSKHHATNKLHPGFHWRGGSIGGIKEEHDIYGHWFSAGAPDRVAILIEDCDLYDCGRTASQDAPRENEEPAEMESMGIVWYRNVRAKNVCMGDGGSAFTVHGNYLGKWILEDVKVELGCDPSVHPDIAQRVTGCVMAYMGSGAFGQKNDVVEIIGGHFEVGRHFQGAGSHRRENIGISNCKEFILRRNSAGEGMAWSHPGCREVARWDMSTIDLARLDSGYVMRGDFCLGSAKHPDPNNDGAGYKSALNALANDPKVIITA